MMVFTLLWNKRTQLCGHANVSFFLRHLLCGVAAKVDYNYTLGHPKSVQVKPASTGGVCMALKLRILTSKTILTSDYK